MEYQLLHALNVGRDDVVSVLAPQLFFNADNTPNYETIVHFEKMANCRVVLATGKVLTNTTGHIMFKGYRFDFS
jgi:hypothetical protein